MYKRQDKLGMGLAKLAEEDPTFRVQTNEETGQTVISGMGELHLDIICLLYTSPGWKDDYLHADRWGAGEKI